MRTKRAGVVVLGAGAMGRATAHQLAKRGEKTLLVEQFDLSHKQGSSHGTARITRHSYADLRYARLMIPAFEAWRELEADAGRTLYIRTGGVSFCRAGVAYASEVAASLDAIGIPYKRMNGEELRRVHPAFEVPVDHDVVFEPDAGVLLAQTTLGVELDLFLKHGGPRAEVLENFPVRRIDLEADRPTLIGDDLVVEADALVVTAGAWVVKLFPDWAAGLTVTRQQVLYVATWNDSFQIGRFPVFVYKGGEGEGSFYGMPALMGDDFKVARHSGPVFDPDSPDRPFDEDYEDVVRHFLRWNLPAAAGGQVFKREVCLYTEDPGENFRIGTYPGRPDVLIASPCSGHGFKFSPLVGKVLAELATVGETSVDISAWRFSPPASP